MQRFSLTYGAVCVVMLALDALWLGVIARPLYLQGIGSLMAEQPRLVIALLFYVVYALGLTVFGVWPQRGKPGWQRSALMGGLFGFFCYATYDLTNLATLKGWPVSLSLIDMAWGTVLSAISAASGKWALDRMS